MLFNTQILNTIQKILLVHFEGAKTNKIKLF